MYRPYRACAPTRNRCVYARALEIRLRDIAKLLPIAFVTGDLGHDRVLIGINSAMSASRQFNCVRYAYQLLLSTRQELFGKNSIRPRQRLIQKDERLECATTSELFIGQIQDGRRVCLKLE